MTFPAAMSQLPRPEIPGFDPKLRSPLGLGAKVALRTAVQDVPPEVLAAAGLRIDYGVPHDYDHDYENGDHR